MSDVAGARPVPIPLILATGFYGTGKTSLLDALAKSGMCPDAIILKAQDIPRLTSQPPSLTLAPTGAGCLCCSGRGDWTGLLERLLRERDNHRMPPFDRLIVETSGEADPVAMLGAVIGHPYLSLRFRPAGIVALVDAATGADTLLRFPQARQQVSVANWIIINDHDAVAPDLLPNLTALAPTARILPLSQALASRDIWSGTGTALAGSEAARRQIYRSALSSGPQRPLHQTVIHHVTFQSTTVLALSELLTFVNGFAEAFGAKVLRISGTASIRERPDVVWAIDVVRARMTPLQPVGHVADKQSNLHLTIIVHDIPPNRINAYCEAYIAACG